MILNYADVEDNDNMMLLNAVDADIESVIEMKDDASKVQAARTSEDALSHVDTQEVISRMVVVVTIQKWKGFYVIPRQTGLSYLFTKMCLCLDSARKTAAISYTFCQHWSIQNLYFRISPRRTPLHRQCLNPLKIQKNGRTTVFGSI